MRITSVCLLCVCLLSVAQGADKKPLVLKSADFAYINKAELLDVKFLDKAYKGKVVTVTSKLLRNWLDDKDNRYIYLFDHLEEMVRKVDKGGDIGIVEVKLTPKSHFLVKFKENMKILREKESEGKTFTFTGTVDKVDSLYISFMITDATLEEK